MIVWKKLLGFEEISTIWFSENCFKKSQIDNDNPPFKSYYYEEKVFETKNPDYHKKTSKFVNYNKTGEINDEFVNKILQLSSHSNLKRIGCGNYNVNSFIDCLLFATNNKIYKKLTIKGLKRI